jgi:hypothetical protein
LTLLWRTGQRIGDWSELHGQHGVLGMRLGDLDRRSGMIVVREYVARNICGPMLPPNYVAPKLCCADVGRVRPRGG